MDRLFEVPNFLFLLIFSIPIAGVIGSCWVKVHQLRYEHDMKRAMIERGMSAEEIERVIKATLGSKPSK